MHETVLKYGLGNEADPLRHAHPCHILRLQIRRKPRVFFGGDIDGARAPQAANAKGARLRIV